MDIAALCLAALTWHAHLAHLLDEASSLLLAAPPVGAALTTHAMLPDVKPAEPERELPELGSVVAGKYEIVRIIGKGGMGVVYEAKHLRLNQRVAIKMLRPAALHLSEFKPRFEREARTAALLRGRHVARIFDVDTTESGLPFMVLEYLVGRDLDAALRERGTLSVVEATGYVLQACIAMHEAHGAGIVHRDLKPANLFLTEENGECIVKVLDFGISKITHEVDTHLTGTFATVGTPLYMSPEQVRSSRTVDARSDIWSLAVILFEALAGQPPFHGSMTATAAAIVADKTPSLRGFRPDVPAELEAVLGCALEKHPNRRYQDVASLMAALAPFGPARLPFSDGSAPILPTPSNPALSQRIIPPGASHPGSDWGSAAETMLIPGDERAAASERASRRLPLMAALVAALAIMGGTALFLRSSSGAAPRSAAPRPTPAIPAPLPVAAKAVDVAPAPSASAEPALSADVPTAVAVPLVTTHAPGYAPPHATPRPEPSHPASSRPPSPTPHPPPPSANPIFLQ